MDSAFPAQAGAMDDEKMEKMVYEYLRRKGYKNAEVAFEEEKNSQRQQFSQTSSNYDQTNPIYFWTGDPPSAYKDQYRKLQSWVHSSLDLYKNELLRILYPVYVHCFMDLVAKGYSQEARTFFQSFREDHDTLHLRDLIKLEGVLAPQHLEECELACSLRATKMQVTMCQYSLDLLMQYVHSTDSRLILAIINAHITTKVVHGQPSPLSEEDEVQGITASMPSHSYDRDKEIHWGTLEDSLEDRLEKEMAAENEKAEADGKAGEAEDGKKRNVEGGKSGAASKKSKKAAGAGKGSKQDANVAATAPRVKSELPIPELDEETEQKILEDLRNRVKLSSTALPSVSFYSFINTHNSLNCATLSADGSLVAGGFSDSSVKVWDMAKIGENHEQLEENGLANGSESNGCLDGKNFTLPESKSGYTLLRGHAGPVYAADFSIDGSFLLSASGDCTVRLWSKKFNSDFVCFKGHNYPVWDVKYSPMGHYFASSSHDRTARIWSVERLQPLRIMAGHLSDVDCVQWHVNCNYIATGSSDKTVRLWDVQSGECMRLFTGHRGMVLSLAMSPDGRYMASGDEDGAIMMWDLASGRCVTPMLGHRGCVWSLAFSGEGSLLASGSADNTVRLWDVNASNKTLRSEDKIGVRRLRLLKTLPTKATPVYTLRFSRRNLLLAAGAFSPPKAERLTT